MINICDYIPIAINVCIAVVVALVSAITAKIRAKLDEKARKAFDDIAATVESVYKGFTAAEKKQAFIDLCRARKLNTKKGASYLETHIIPVSNQVNCYKPADKEKSNIII